MQALPNGTGDVIVAGGRGLVVTSLDANLIRAIGSEGGCAPAQDSRGRGGRKRDLLIRAEGA